MTLRRYHAAVWDEPLVMEMGATGRRGIVFDEDPALRTAVGDPAALVPTSARRAQPPALPELSEPEVLRHYLHLSQETLGMMGVSLFGTCTMKYNPRLAWELVARPEIAELHPQQDDDTLQGVLALVHGLDLILRGVSGMDQFVFQAGGGAHAAFTHAVITRAYHASRGELAQRDEIVDGIDIRRALHGGRGRAGHVEQIVTPLGFHRHFRPRARDRADQGQSPRHRRVHRRVGLHLCQHPARRHRRGETSAGGRLDRRPRPHPRAPRVAHPRP